MEFANFVFAVFFFSSLILVLQATAYERLLQSYEYYAIYYIVIAYIRNLLPAS